MPSSKRVVVTGAASGIGSAAAELLLAEGHEVIALDVKQPAHPVTEFIEMDLGEPASIDAGVGRVPRPVDALLNVAGVPGPTPRERVMRVNLLGLRQLSRALLPRLADGGAIVNVASMAAVNWKRRRDDIQALLDTPDFAAGLAWCRENEDRVLRDAYVFSKECVVVLTMRMAGWARERGIRANSVSPGPVDTPILPDFAAQVGAEQLRWVGDQVGRYAQPADIGEVLALLAAGHCRWLNGQDIVVDGGFNAGLASGWIDRASSPAARARARREPGSAQ